MRGPQDATPESIQRNAERLVALAAELTSLRTRSEALLRAAEALKNALEIHRWSCPFEDRGSPDGFAYPIHEALVAFDAALAIAAYKGEA